MDIYKPGDVLEFREREKGLRTIISKREIFFRYLVKENGSVANKGSCDDANVLFRIDNLKNKNSFFEVCVDDNSTPLLYIKKGGSSSIKRVSLSELKDPYDMRDGNLQRILFTFLPLIVIAVMGDMIFATKTMSIFPFSFKALDYLSSAFLISLGVALAIWIVWIAFEKGFGIEISDFLSSSSQYWKIVGSILGGIVTVGILGYILVGFFSISPVILLTVCLLFLISQFNKTLNSWEEQIHQENWRRLGSDIENLRLQFDFLEKQEIYELTNWINTRFNQEISLPLHVNVVSPETLVAISESTFVEQLKQGGVRTLQSAFLLKNKLNPELRGHNNQRLESISTSHSSNDS